MIVALWPLDYQVIWWISWLVALLMVAAIVVLQLTIRRMSRIVRVMTESHHDCEQGGCQLPASTGGPDPRAETPPAPWVRYDA